jgi:phospholipase D1/2
MTFRPVLEEGKTCWRIEHADRFAMIVDAAAYFAAAKAAIQQARHAVLLIGWDFDPRIELTPGASGDDAPQDDAPDELRAFLKHMVATRPDLEIYVLRWDMAALKMPIRGITPIFVLDWMVGDRLHFRLDHEHPAGASHHQKIVVVDDVLAFCGGIDMTNDRWDTPEHKDDDPRRVRPGGSTYGPWHDITAIVDADAARALGELARMRWRRATGKEIPACPTRDPIWPRNVTPDFRDIDVGIARTDPAQGDQPAVREIEALYLAAIAAARRTIYIETQYFASSRIVDALIARLREQDGPEIVVINPLSAADWLEEAVMGGARAILVTRAQTADAHGRFRIYTPVTEKGCDIYVHAKALIVDDRLLRLGSSNVNNRSMGLDTESDVIVEGQDEASREAILAVRDRLTSEHLGVSQQEMREACRSGSLIAAIEGLMRPSGRSLRTFYPPSLNQAEAALADSTLLDPESPEQFTRALRKSWLPYIGGGALASLAAMVGWRFARR